MSIDITTLLSQRPNFIGINEPVCGSSDPINQTVTILPDGTIVNSIEGVDNRATGQLWGMFKLLSQIFLNGHNDDGTHDLSDSDISVTAEIAESKLALDFEGLLRPSGGTYASTSDIIDEINTWYPYYRISSVIAAVRSNERDEEGACKVFPFGWNINNYEPHGDSEGLLVSDEDVLKFNKWNIKVKNSNRSSGDGKSIIMIPDASDISTNGFTSEYIVWLECWIHNVSTTGYAFPCGNTEYLNTNSVSGEHGINYDHTDQVVALNTSAWDNFIKDRDNNIDISASGDVIQLAYKLRCELIDYDLYKDGLDSSVITSFITSQPVVRSSEIKGIWKSIDGVSYLIPMVICTRKNKGIFHKTVNPNGTAILRTGAPFVTSFIECFEQYRIAYFSTSSVECPDYSSAVYNNTEDFYTYNSVEYYRSGDSRTAITGKTDGSFFDIIDSDDCLNVKCKCYDNISTIAEDAFNKLFSGSLLTSLTPVYYGNIDSKNTSDIWSKSPTQIVGFGLSEAISFGTNNVGGLFVNKSNNNKTAFADSCRTCWVDYEYEQSITFSFTEGLDNSESRPALVTYEPVSQTISLNSTGLSGIPLIVGPVNMVWEDDNTEATLTTPWTGLGTTSASCQINTAGHTGKLLYGMCKLRFEKGSGTEFILENVIKVEDPYGVNYDFIYKKDLDLLNSYSFVGDVANGSTTNTIALDSSASPINNYYQNQYVCITQTSTSNPVGITRKIISYDGISKTALLDQVLPEALITGDKISISWIDISSGCTVIIDSFGRGVLGGIRRDKYSVSSTGNTLYINKPIFATSAGTILGGTIVGLTANEVVDVITYENTPFNYSFMIHFKNNSKIHIFESLPNTGKATIVDSGKSFMSTVGSANDGSFAYMCVIPSTTFPSTDLVKWVGTCLPQDYNNMIIENDELCWKNIVPWDELTFDYNTLLINKTCDNVQLGLESRVSVTDINSGFIVSAILVIDDDGYKLLTGVSHFGELTFKDLQKVFMVDISRIYSCNI